jgi:hypothetical protein
MGKKCALYGKLGVVPGILEITKGLAWHIVYLRKLFTVLISCVIFRARRNKTRAIAIAIACAMAYVYLSTEQSSFDNRQSMWTKKWLSEKDKYSHMQLLRELRENNPDDFRNYL